MNVHTHLVEVLGCGSHLLPRFIQQLDADTEKLLPRSIMSEEHWMIIITALVCYTHTQYLLFHLLYLGVYL